MTLIKKGGVEGLVSRPDAKLRGALIHGGDRTAVTEVAQRLLRRVTADPDDPFSVALLSETDLDPERLAAELSARSLTGGRRVVRLRLTGELGAKDKIVQELVQSQLDDAYQSDAFLLIESGALDKRSGLRKLSEAEPRFASVILYEEEGGDLSRLARETLDGLGVKASPSIIALLSDRLPRDRGVARQAIEALALYVGPLGAIDLAALDAVAPVDSGGAAADVALSAFSGRVELTVTALRRAAFMGESGPALLRSLSMHRMRLARVKAAVDGGAPQQSAVKSAGVFWKDEGVVIEQVSLWRRAELEQLQTDLLEADAACKTAGAPDELIAHHWALQIARTHARGGSSRVR